jgi:hypothetical protein
MEKDPNSDALNKRLTSWKKLMEKDSNSDAVNKRATS